MAFLDELRKNVSDLTENVAKKSSSVIETQKMKMNRSSLESDLRDDYVQMGKLYEKKLSLLVDDDEAAIELLEKIVSKKRAISEIEDQLMKAKGLIACAGCGSDVSRDFDFCPRCGAKLEKPEPEKEVISPDDVIVEGDGQSTAQDVDKHEDAQDAAPEENIEKQ